MKSIDESEYKKAAGLLRYDPKSGLMWREYTSSGWKVSGCVDRQQGYVLIKAGGSKLLKAHRLATYIMEGHVPQVIDHINGIRNDNRWCNLRGCTHAENIRNQKSLKKYKGVYARKDRRAASISYNGISHYLGRFQSDIDAAKAYNEMAIKLHGKFARLNIV